MRPEPQAVTKKPYQTPKLLVYGNLTEMTKSAGTKAQRDGAVLGVKRRTGR
jgi:hypothetical protein